MQSSPTVPRSEQSETAAWHLLDELLRDMAQLEQDVKSELTTQWDDLDPHRDIAVAYAVDLIGDVVQEFRRRVWVAHLEASRRSP